MAFFFRHQPLKSLYLFYATITLMFIRLPYWTLTNILPLWRPRRTWSLTHVIMVKILRFATDTCFQTSIFVTVDPSNIEESGLANKYGLVWIKPTPELIVGEIKDMADINHIVAVEVAGYWYGQRGTDGQVGQPASPDEKVICELHGGGWVMGSATPQWDSGYMCDEMIKYADGYSRASQVEYRLARGPPHPPTNAFPAALIDAIAGYNYLVNELGFKPSNILVSGESSGGSLAFALVRYLTNAKLPQLDLPHAQFLLCPSGDWGRTHIGPQSSMERNSKSDYVHALNAGYNIRALLGSLPDEEAHSSWISPGGLRLSRVNGQFAGMPPTLIMAGDAEMTLDGIKMMRDRVVEDCGDALIKYIELPDTGHIVMTLKWHEPQRTRAYEEFARWLRTVDEQK